MSRPLRAFARAIFDALAAAPSLLNEAMRSRSRSTLIARFRKWEARERGPGVCGGHWLALFKTFAAFSLHLARSGQDAFRARAGTPLIKLHLSSLLSVCVCLCRGLQCPHALLEVH